MTQLADELTMIPDKRTRNRAKGFAMVLTAAVLWGVSGSVAQVLFQSDGYQAGWLVTVRMGISGLLLLLAVTFGTGAKGLFAVWRTPSDAFRLILFSVLGLVGVQFSYFSSIQFGNAATATILQYIAPVFVALYGILRYRRKPSRWELFSILLAVSGTFFLTTDGHWSTLQISVPAFVWGVISAITLAFYTLYPGGILQRYGSACIVGWAMLVGSICLPLVNPPWVVHGVASAQTYAMIGFVVLFGTLIPFYMYLASLRFLSGQETSLIACAEPLSAAVVGVACLNVKFGPFAVLGAVFVLLSMGVLARKGT